MTDLNLELLRVAIAIAGTAYLAWQDARTSFMDERVLYAMAAAGLLLNLLVWEPGFLLSSVGLAAVVFAFGYLLYKAGQLGGGDVWLFAALQMLLPAYPSGVAVALAPALSSVVPNFAAAVQLSVSFAGRAYPFLLSILSASAFLALWGSALMYAWKLRGRRLKPDSLLLVGMLALLIAILFWMNSVLQASAGMSALMVLLLLPGAFLTSFRRQLLDEVVVKRVSISQIEDEDILALEKMPARLVRKYKLGRVLTVAEVKKLRLLQRKEGLRLFPVCKVLPRFGPYILLGLLVSLLLGDLFAFVLLF